MRKPNRVLLISAGVATLALGLTLTAAHAASAGSRPAARSAGMTWSISPMGQFDEPGNVGPTVLTDRSTNGKISCKFATSAMKPPGGMGLRHTLVAFTGMTFSQCALPDGTSVSLAPVSLPWTLTGGRFDPSRNLGVTTGEVHHVSLSFSSSSCSGVLDGSAAGANDGTVIYQFYNNPHWFVFRTWSSTLHAYNVSGCSGIFSNGDKVTLHGVLAALALVITSP
jgi:hypothetical protein